VDRPRGSAQALPECLTAIMLNGAVIANHPPRAVTFHAERVVKRLWPLLEGL